MRLLNKVKAVFTMKPSTWLLLIEAGYYLAVIRFRLLYFSFAKLAPSLGVFMQETDTAFRNEDRATLIRVRQAIDIMSRNTFWETKCLVRAITAMKMLERRKVSSTLYLGTAKDENGKMIAHAWLRSGSLYVTGAEEMDRFTTTGTFAKSIL